MRIACRKFGAPNLKGATLYTSCEPRPTCYSTAYWARVDGIYVAASWTDRAGLFDDRNIGLDLRRSHASRDVPVSQVMRADVQRVWDQYRKLPDKTRY